MVTVVIEGVWPFLIFYLSCNVSIISNQSFADAHSSNITRLTLPMPMAESFIVLVLEILQ
jgi:hypothetical protein